MIEPARRHEVSEPAPGSLGVGSEGVLALVSAELRAALAMLTRLPVAAGSGERAGASAYAIVGALIGLIGLVPLVILGPTVPWVAAILAIAGIAIVSGAVHLDGLADTADALVALGPDGAERARKDPAIGVGGAATLVVVLGLQAASLGFLAVDATPLAAGIACVVAGGVSRSVPVVLARFAGTRVRSDGLAGWFAARTTNAAAIAAAGSTVTMGLVGAFALGGPAVAAAGAIGGIGGVAVGMGLVRTRGQLDGDLLGASVELTFALTVVAAATLVARVGG